MTVQNLIDLLTEVEDKSIPVYIQDGDHFNHVNDENTGYSVAGEPCDEKGNPLPTEGEEMPFFNVSSDFPERK